MRRNEETICLAVAAGLVLNPFPNPTLNLISFDQIATAHAEELEIRPVKNSPADEHPTKVLGRQALEIAVRSET